MCVCVSVCECVSVLIVVVSGYTYIKFEVLPRY